MSKQQHRRLDALGQLMMADTPQERRHQLEAFVMREPDATIIALHPLMKEIAGWLYSGGLSEEEAIKAAAERYLASGEFAEGVE
jgi:hypothetical protein